MLLIAFIKKTRVVLWLTILGSTANLQLEAQDKTQGITLDLRDATMEQAFLQIQQQSNYQFIYTSEQLRDTRRINLSLRNITLETALSGCFSGQPLDYTLDGHYIIVQSKSRPSKQKDSSAPKIKVIGRVLNEKSEPLAGVTVSVMGTVLATATDTNGIFAFEQLEKNAILVFTGVNIETQEVHLRGKGSLVVHAVPKITGLSDVSLSVNSGYQQIAQERTTGSFVKIDNELFNRSTGADVLSRLDGITSGLIFNKNRVNGTNQSKISIRGRGTIFANAEPLIVLDNFPYDGDINNINPNDVESVTILRDAAAASIWGVQSGNGVIVITTKKGGYNQPIKISLNSNWTLGEKPDIYYTPRLGSVDYIGVEKFLFDKSFYDGQIPYPSYYALSPVVEILDRKKTGQITAQEADAQLSNLENTDTRRDLEKYLFQRSFNRQYALNLSGGGQDQKYYFSAGFDQNRLSLVSNQFERVTLNANNTYSMLNQKMELTSGITFAYSRTKNNNNGFLPVIYPYLQLADATGKALAVPYQHSIRFVDTVGQGLLPDWHYRPLDEVRSGNNITTLTDYRLSAQLKYQFWKGFDITLLYQYSGGNSDQELDRGVDAYYTRNLVNQFTIIDYNRGNLQRPIPLGSILDNTLNKYTSHQLRSQLNYSVAWGNHHQVSAIAGTEIKSLHADYMSNRLYGYDKELATSIPVDYVHEFPVPSLYTSATIPNPAYQAFSTDHYRSFFFNGAYQYRHRYGLSLSARKDASNLFGVSANQKSVPLWSLGISWDISRENFWRFKSLPYLKIRLTDGYNGNLDKTVTAFTTALVAPNNQYQAPTAVITNPPNPALRWEKIHILNLGLDFSTRNHILSGSLEYYVKNGTDLIGMSQMDPTAGVNQFTGNTANMKGQGFDIQLSSINISGAFQWTSSFLMSHTTDKVTRYLMKQSSIGFYLNPGIIGPLEGKPLYSIYGLYWEGLDPQTGDPQGLLNGHVSKDYSAILKSSNITDLHFHGPANPVWFGSLRNTFSYQQFTFSCNIVYKLGYYYRRNSVNYSNLFNGGFGHPDYEKRWQQSGDETRTIVPSSIFPADPVRDEFYAYSDPLVGKGDHIRLQDIQLSYEFTKNKFRKMPCQSLRLYFYANNLGILWRANQEGIDPDVVPSGTWIYPDPRSFSAGIKLDF